MAARSACPALHAAALAVPTGATALALSACRARVLSTFLLGLLQVTQLLSSSEVRARIKMSDDGDDQTPMRAGSRESVSFSESERGELEAGNFAMVEGLVSPAVLAHIIRYKLYCS